MKVFATGFYLHRCYNRDGEELRHRIHQFLIPTATTVPSSHLTQRDGVIDVNGVSIDHKDYNRQYNCTHQDCHDSTATLENVRYIMCDEGTKSSVVSVTSKKYLEEDDYDDYDDDIEDDHEGEDDIEDVKESILADLKSIKIIVDGHFDCYCKTQQVCGCGCDPEHDGW